MNFIGPEGAKALAASPHLERIQHLRMGMNPLGVEGVEVLKKRFGDRLEADPPLQEANERDHRRHARSKPEPNPAPRSPGRRRTSVE